MMIFCFCLGIVLSECWRLRWDKHTRDRQTLGDLDGHGGPSGGLMVPVARGGLKCPDSTQLRIHDLTQVYNSFQNEYVRSQLDQPLKTSAFNPSNARRKRGFWQKKESGKIYTCGSHVLWPSLFSFGSPVLRFCNRRASVGFCRSSTDQGKLKPYWPRSYRGRAKIYRGRMYLGLPFTTVKTSLKIWGIPRKIVWWDLKQLLLPKFHQILTGVPVIYK